MIDIVYELSLRLSEFNRKSESISIIEEAIEVNNWFSRADICRSVEAIRTQMLSKSKFEEWMASYPALPCRSARRIAIIMAGNIPLVGFSDLLCTLAAGHEAWIKPSSKDRVLMEYLYKMLKEIEPLIPIFMYDDSIEYEAIIATGGQEANRYFESKFQGIKRLCRNNRHSIAILSEQSTQEQMQLLAEDIYQYSGLGCRNVSMIFAPKGSKIELPSIEVNQKYRNNYLQTKALLTISGKEFIDNGSSVIIRSAEFPHHLSAISLFEYDSLKQVEAWICEHEDVLQCIVTQILTHPRQVNFGEAQHPTLFDYADGVDTMNFLNF